MREADERCDPEDVVGRVRAQVHAYCRFAVDSPGHYRLILNSGRHRAPGRRPRGRWCRW
ncbi:hypothetical protein NKH77_03075 [Streptomyces sp. M19]